MDTLFVVTHCTSIALPMRTHRPRVQSSFLTSGLILEHCMAKILRCLISVTDGTPINLPVPCIVLLLYKTVQYLIYCMIQGTISLTERQGLRDVGC